MQRHDVDLVVVGRLLDIHHQRNMFEETSEVLELAHRAHQLFEILKAPLGFRALVVLPHLGVARFVEHDLGKLRVRNTGHHLAPAAKAFEQVAQRGAGLGRQFISQGDGLGGAIERDALGARNAMQALHRGIADAAFRCVDDAFEGEIIVGRGDDFEIGQRIADLGALIKARAADHTIGHTQGDEAVFEGPHLERGAHQDRHVIELFLASLQVLDVIADDAGFLIAIPVRAHDDGVAIITVGTQGFPQSALVFSDEARGGAQDLRRRAVVAFEPDDLGAGKVFLEAQDVIDLGAAPAIDRLIVVTHHADVLVALRQQAQPEILRDVGVLIFVHQHVLETALILFQHIGMGLKDAQRLKQQIAEIAGVHHFQALLISGIELAALAVKFLGFASRHLVGSQATVFPAIDEVGELAGRPALLVDVMGLHQLFHQPDLVIGIENRKAGTKPRQLDMIAQDLDADGMESAEPGHALDDATDQRADPVLHLARRLVGEGDGQQLPRPGLAGGQNMRQPGRQHAGLAGAGTGQHQQRTIGRLHCQALLGVQALEIGGLRLRHGTRRQAPRFYRRCGGIIAEIIEVERLGCHQGSNPCGPP